jgi:hypothetical protein
MAIKRLTHMLRRLICFVFLIQFVMSFAIGQILRDRVHNEKTELRVADGASIVLIFHVPAYVEDIGLVENCRELNIQELVPRQHSWQGGKDEPCPFRIAIRSVELKISQRWDSLRGDIRKRSQHFFIKPIDRLRQCISTGAFLKMVGWRSSAVAEMNYQYEGLAFFELLNLKRTYAKPSPLILMKVINGGTERPLCFLVRGSARDLHLLLLKFQLAECIPACVIDTHSCAREVIRGLLNLSGSVFNSLGIGNDLVHLRRSTDVVDYSKQNLTECEQYDGRAKSEFDVSIWPSAAKFSPIQATTFLAKTQGLFCIIGAYITVLLMMIGMLFAIATEPADRRDYWIIAVAEVGLFVIAVGLIHHGLWLLLGSHESIMKGI